MIEVEEVFDAKGFAKIRPEWDDMMVPSESGFPFLGWSWQHAWYKHFGGGRSLRIFAARENGRLIGILNFFEHCSGPSPFRLRILKQMASDNWLTERFGPILGAHRRREALNALLAYLIRHRDRLWDVLEVDGVAPEDIPYEAHEWIRVQELKQYAVVANVPETWRQYTSTLSPSTRWKLAYYTRALSRRHRVEFRTAVEPDEMESALEHFFRLHRARSELRGSVEHEDRFSLPSQRSFLKDCLGSLSSQAGARVEILLIDDQEAAVQIAFQSGRNLCIYYSGFDPQWKKYSIGMCLLARTIERGIDSGAQRIDFLSYLAPYKTKWGAQPELVPKVILVRDAVKARMVFGARSVKNQVLGIAPASLRNLGQ